MIMVSLPGKIAWVCNIDPSQDLSRYRDYLSDICTQCAIARGATEGGTFYGKFDTLEYR